jgi:hypothetical protein
LELAPEKDAPLQNFVDPLLQNYLNCRVTVVWKDQTRRDGILTAASHDWLQLQSDDGPLLLVPREAIAWLEIIQ